LPTSSELRKELAALETLSNDELQQYVRAQYDPAKLARYDALLAFNVTDSLQLD
jgi:hypothetical protein